MTIEVIMVFAMNSKEVKKLSKWVACAYNLTIHHSKYIFCYKNYL